MTAPFPIEVIRLGHRPGRDERMTTHVGLTARALGAARVTLPVQAGDAVETTRDVTERFGGPFEVRTHTGPGDALRGIDGTVVHLTMYGEGVQEIMPEIRESTVLEPASGVDPELAVVVGGGKVPFDVYDRADWNVAVTNQPHSEVAALAVFLDRLLEGDELDRVFEGADRRIIPRAVGKRVEDVDPDEDANG